MVDRITPKDIGPIIKERNLYPNGYLVLIARDCPEDIASDINFQTEQSGIEWFLKGKASKDFTPSTRDIFFANRIVVKKNHPRKLP